MCTDLVGATPDGRQVNIWEQLGIPLITFFGDSPAYYFDRHIVPSSLFVCLYGFDEHYVLRKRLPKVNGLIGTPPKLPLDVTAKEAIDFSAKERGRLLFLKNGNDPQKLLIAWRDHLSPSVFAMLADLASELVDKIATPLGNDIDSLVCKYFTDKGLDAETLPKLRLFFIAQLDDYLRRVKSSSIVELLLDFPIEIHGYNWEHIDFSGKRATLVHGGDYTKSKPLIERSLGLLDMSPNTTSAPHDRPLRAFGMYTLCLTNEQQCFTEQFVQHDTFTFRFEGESLQTRVADVLAHPKRYVELGIEVAESFRKRHSGRDFGVFIEEAASVVRLAWEGRPGGMQDFFVWPPQKLS